MRASHSNKELLPAVRAMDVLRRIQKERKTQFAKLINDKKLERAVANHRYLCFDNAIAEINWFLEVEKSFKREFPGQYKAIEEVIEEVERESKACQAEYAARGMFAAEMKYRMQGFQDTLQILKLTAEGKIKEVKAMGEQLKLL